MTGLGSSRGFPGRLVLPAVFALGVSCVMTQLALLREMLCVFAGNELVLGVVLGNWLLLMGLGASLGRWAGRVKEPLGLLAALLIFTAVVPPAQVLALRGLRSFIFLRGVDLGVGPTFATSLVVLLPYCLAAGFTLALACWLLASEGDARGPGRVYVADSLGSILGGLLFSFVLVQWLDHFALLCVPALLNLAVAAWLAWQIRPRIADRDKSGAEPPDTLVRRASTTLPEPRPLTPALSPDGGEGGRRPGEGDWFRVPTHGSHAVRTTHDSMAIGTWLMAAVGLLAFGLLVLVLVADPDTSSTELQFPGQQVLFQGHSPYGRLVVTAAGGQTNFIENGVVVATIPSLGQAEEMAHYAMTQRPGARRVLLVSGSPSGTLREILRYGIAELHCVELDPLVVTTVRRLMPKEFTDRRLRLFTMDPRQFVRRTGVKYDVVILALPDPSTAQINRLFTAECFDEIQRILVPGGVVALGLGRYENYAGPELSRLLSCGRRTLAQRFKNVALIPGGRVYLLASEGPLSLNIAASLERLKLQPRLVNRNYLAAMLSPDRLAAVNRAAAQPAAINRDLSPALYLLQLRHWGSQFQGGLGPLQLLLVGGLLFYLVRLRGAARVIFAAGFAGTALELVLLLGWQILVGSLYQQVALLVTLFMAGLALGAWGANRWLGENPRAAGVVRAANPESLSMPASGCAGTGVPTVRALRSTAFAIASIGALLPLLLRALEFSNRHAGGPVLVPTVIGLLTFSLAAISGAQFALANRLAPDATGRTAARLYTADFVGAFLGALLTSTLLVPLIGVTGACLVAAALNLFGGGVLRQPAVV